MTGGNILENVEKEVGSQGGASPSAIAAITGSGNPGGPVDLSQDPAEGPKQPQLKSYLRRTFGSQAQLTLRSLNH